MTTLKRATTASPGEAQNQIPVIHDLIAERLRQFRQTGLGDPDEESAPEKAAPSAGGAEDELATARELLAETRNLRATLAGSPR